MPGTRRYDDDVAGMHQHTVTARNGVTVELIWAGLADIGPVASIIEQHIALLDHQFFVPAHVLFDMAGCRAPSETHAETAFFR